MGRPYEEAYFRTSQKNNHMTSTNKTISDKKYSFLVT